MKRDPESLLSLSLRFAKEYFDTLCKMQMNLDEVQESKELTMIHRALWTALIIEVGRLFDTYTNKDVISFKKLPHLKEKIDKFHGEAIIEKILDTRNTFTGHFARKENKISLAPEICNSNLGTILNEMSNLSITEDNSEEHQNVEIKA